MSLQRTFSNVCKTFFVATMGEGGYVLLASNGWKPEILLKTLKCTGHAPYTYTRAHTHTEMVLPKMLVVLRL